MHMQGSYRSKAFISSLKSFFHNNKKVLICAIVIFTIGIVVGVLSEVRSVSGDFERVAKADIEYSCAKVFFIAFLALLGAYVLFLLASINSKTLVLCLLPFVALGFVLGEYSTALVARYETSGVLNLLFVYLPFFLSTLCCFLLCACQITAPNCACTGQVYRQSFVETIKIFAINVALAFIVFLIVGAIFGVIVVQLY